MSVSGNTQQAVLPEDAIAQSAVSQIYSPSAAQELAAAEIAALLYPARTAGKACGDGEATPFLDIQRLFSLYDAVYFQNILRASGVEVLWSSRLTLCAGICEAKPDPKTKTRTVRVKLSEPLLQYRPRSDVLDTLLHELIHAFFFVTTCFRHLRTAAPSSSNEANGGHGDAFLLLAHAINAHGGYGITVFHSFHDEVDYLRKHIWKCDGPCQNRPPYFGIVKRSMNRPPGKSDMWWARHERDCGGQYTKIAEPEKKEKEKPDRKRAREGTGSSAKDGQKNKLDGWLKPRVAGLTDPSSKPGPAAAARLPGAAVEIEPGVILLEDDADDGYPIDDGPALKKTLVECPVCAKPVEERLINVHLDEVHF